jgi:hypothetical protein
MDLPLRMPGNSSLDNLSVMRKWLDEHSLPHTVGDALVELDARSVDDVRLVIQECPELVSAIAPLDRVKLQKAVKMQTLDVAKKK